jgi:hypothetical protein
MSRDCVPKWPAGLTHALRVELKRAGAKPDPFLPFNPNRGNYPFVTTGGGALPLPVLAQPTMLRRARTAAVASASCFMKKLPCHDQATTSGAHATL